MAERKYDDTEVGQILSQAAATQTGSSDLVDTNGVTLQELIRIAEEVGIQPDHIRRAATDLDHKRRVQPSSNPNSVLMEQSVHGELSVEAWEQMITSAQSFTGKPGRSTQNEWRSGDGNNSVTISNTVRNGQTYLKLLGDSSGTVSWMWEVGFGFVMFTTLFPLILTLKFHPETSPIIIFLMMAATAMLSRLAVVAKIRAQRNAHVRDMNGLMDRLLTIAESSKYESITHIEQKSSVAPTVDRITT